MYYFWLGRNAENLFEELVEEIRAKRRVGYMYGDIWYV